MASATKRFINPPQQPTEEIDTVEDCGDSMGLLGNPAFTEVAFWHFEQVLGVQKEACHV